MLLKMHQEMKLVVNYQEDSRIGLLRGDARASVTSVAKYSRILYLQPHASPRLQMISIFPMCNTYYLRFVEKR